jgi:antirestriction protein ArdC
VPPQFLPINLYRGVNVLLPQGEAREKGYAAPLWMTYKQSQELGAEGGKE